MGCKLALPLGVFRHPSDRHERLDEDDERYFLKVEARNKSSFHLEWNGFGSDPPPPNTAVIGLDRAESTETSTLQGDEVELVVVSSDSNRSTEGHKKKISPIAARVDREKWQRPTATSADDATAHSLESKHSRTGLGRLGQSHPLFHADTTTSPRPSFDYWSTPGESQFDTASDASSRDVFETLLPNCMIWEAIKTTGKVTAVSMVNTKSSNADEGMHHDDILLLAIGTDDGNACIVEVRDECMQKSDESVRKLGASQDVVRKGKIRSLDFSSDGFLLAVAGDDCFVSIYQILMLHQGDNHEFEGMALVGELERVDRIYAARFSPDGTLLAVGGFDSIVTIATVSWDGEKVAIQVVTEIHRQGLVLCLDWRPDGQVLAIGGTDKSAVIVDKTWNVVGEISRNASVECVRWNPDGSSLAVVSGSAVAVVDATNLDVTGEIEHRDRSASGSSILDDVAFRSSSPPKRAGRICSVSWSPDGAFFALAGSDGCCEFVDSCGFTRVHEIQRQKATTSLAWGEKRLASGDCTRFLAIGGDDNCVVILKAGIDIEGSSTIGDSSSITSYVSSESQPVQEWVFKEGSFRDMEEHQHVMDESNSVVEAVQKVTCVAFSRGSKSKPSPYFAYATEGCFVSITSTKRWESIARLEFVKPMRSIQFANTNNLLVLGGDDAILYVVSISAQKLIAEKILTSPISALGFSWADERLAVASVDGLLALLDPREEFDVVGEIDGNDATIMALDWSCKNLGVGRSDGSVAVHDIDKVFGNFFVPHVELQKREAIHSLAFGVSGRFLAVGGDDGKLSVYSEKGDWVLCHQVNVESTIRAVNWSPTGRYIGYCSTSFTQFCQVIDTVLWVEVNEIQQQLILQNNGNSISVDEDNENMKPLGTSLCWNADGSLLALGTANHGIHIVETTAQWNQVICLSAR